MMRQNSRLPEPLVVLGPPEAVDVETLYRALRIMTDFAADGGVIVGALTSALADYLRAAPAEARGHLADQVIEHLRNDVRKSLQ